MDWYGHDTVIPRVVKIVMAPPDMYKGKPGPLEGFDCLPTGDPGKLHATTGSFSFTSTSTGTGFFRIVRVSI